jgi:hypothetical protein
MLLIASKFRNVALGTLLLGLAAAGPVHADTISFDECATAGCPEGNLTISFSAWNQSNVNFAGFGAGDRSLDFVNTESLHVELYQLGGGLLNQPAINPGTLYYIALTEQGGSAISEIVYFTYTGPHSDPHFSQPVSYFPQVEATIWREFPAHSFGRNACSETPSSAST